MLFLPALPFIVYRGHVLPKTFNPFSRIVPLSTIARTVNNRHASFKSLHFSWILLSPFFSFNQQNPLFPPSKERSETQTDSQNMDLSKHYLSLRILLYDTSPSILFFDNREKKNSTLPSSSTSLSRHQSIPLLLVDIVYKHTWHGSIHEAVIYVCPRQSANQPRQSGDGDLYSRGSAEGESAADEIGRVLRSSRFASSTLRVSLPFACICTRYVYTSCNTPPPILRNGIVVKM